MQNYFNYYTEIEEHFQRRRGTLLMLSTVDWALIATWQEAGFPLEAVLAGINATFDKQAAKQTKGRARKVNGLAYCAQEVLRAVEDAHEAATGASRRHRPSPDESGFEMRRIANHLRNAVEQLRTASVPKNAWPVFEEATEKLTELANSLQENATNSKPISSMESLENTLLALEDQLFAALQAFSPSEDLIALRNQSTRELAPYRSRLQATQVRQIEQQFLRRCLFEQNRIPRLSLFYMRQT